MRNVFAHLAPLLFGGACALLAGCDLSRPAPVKNTFLLDPRIPAAATVQKPVTLRIGTINVAAPYRDRTFVYRTGELQYESDFYHEFFTAPASMIAQAATKALTGAKVFARVVPAGTAPEDGDYVLEAFVSDLYADTRSKPPYAVVSITFFVTRTTFPAGVVWSQPYSERIALALATPDALATAWNEGLSRVLESLARDLAASNAFAGDRAG
ncbi:MAG TPA: ABC-type transport auxiliary lipoprotein family protein [Casimicrobiaceae bacterium]|nr:ABC-type transport auxiliary lipoprotein family protein [Casimicrobiaceae bacterium]